MEKEDTLSIKDIQQNYHKGYYTSSSANEYDNDKDTENTPERRTKAINALNEIMTNEDTPTNIYCEASLLHARLLLEEKNPADPAEIVKSIDNDIQLVLVLSDSSSEQAAQAEAYLIKANALLTLEKEDQDAVAKAIVLCNEAISLSEKTPDKEIPEFYITRAEVRIELGLYSLAQEDLKKVSTQQLTTHRLSLLLKYSEMCRHLPLSQVYSKKEQEKDQRAERQLLAGISNLSDFKQAYKLSTITTSPIEEEEEEVIDIDIIEETTEPVRQASLWGRLWNSVNILGCGGSNSTSQPYKPMEPK